MPRKTSVPADRRGIEGPAELDALQKAVTSSAQMIGSHTSDLEIAFNRAIITIGEMLKEREELLKEIDAQDDEIETLRGRLAERSMSEAAAETVELRRQLTSPTPPF